VAEACVESISENGAGCGLGWQRGDLMVCQIIILTLQGGLLCGATEDNGLRQSSIVRAAGVCYTYLVAGNDALNRRQSAYIPRIITIAG
jgi:hypothetical protein